MDVDDLKQRIVDGLQVLTGEGILTGAGHLSVRIPGTDTFLINPRFPGALADPEDICTVNLEGKRIAGKGPIPSETPIHVAAYRARPDVGSVLHAHPRFSILLGVQGIGLVPFNRQAATFADGLPIFPNSRGIDSMELGEQMVEELGGHYGVLLRGHGIVVVSPTVEYTCVSAINLERACEDQLLLTLLGGANPMPEATGGRPRSPQRMENPYRDWPFLLFRHGVRGKEQIKASVRVPEEGVSYR